MRPGEICGHTGNFLMVWIQDEGDGPNQLLDVEFIENTPQGLIGNVVKRCNQKQRYCG